MGLPETAQEARETELGRPTLLEIAKSFEPMLLAAEGVIENERRIPQEITDGFYDSGIYRAFMPRELGGLEVHPIEWLGLRRGSLQDQRVGGMAVHAAHRRHLGQAWR